MPDLKMSKQDDVASWVPTMDAKREYFLSAVELATLPFEYPPIQQSPRHGRPVKLFNPKDLKQLAEQKYGKDDFETRLARRKLKKRGRIPKKLLMDNQVKGQKRREKAKRRKHVREIPCEDQDDGDDIETLCSVTKNCDKEQLQQLITLTAQNNSTFISAINEIKDVALLSRSSFQRVHPRLAKLLSPDDENELQTSHEEDSKIHNKEYEQKELNMALDGKWVLKVAAPPHKKGEEGTMEVILYGSGFTAGGDIYFKSSCMSGDIEGFKKNSSIENKAMSFETRSRTCDKWCTGALRVSVSSDIQGLLLSGSFWPGYKEQGVTNTFQFTGRKVNIEDD